MYCAAYSICYRATLKSTILPHILALSVIENTSGIEELFNVPRAASRFSFRLTALASQILNSKYPVGFVRSAFLPQP